MSDSDEVGADLTGVDTWIFDLDNTLYPAGGAFMTLIEARMSAYVARFTGLPHDEAYALQKRYLVEHGATLAGLMANHEIDPLEFLNEVHDVSLDELRPDHRLKMALKRLPGRRLVFTNGPAAHAFRVLDRLGLADLFDQVFHLESGGQLIPKPRQEAFDAIVALHDVTPGNAAFFEDTEKNLAPAEAMGMTTVLVGAHALTSTARFVHHRTEHLAPFLEAARLRQDS